MDARREVSNYIGLEKIPAPNPPSLADLAKDLFAYLVERFITNELTAEERKMLMEKIIDRVIEEFPGIDTKLLTNGS